MSRLQVGTENGAPIEIHYQDYGSGKPVVLIHGWPLSGRSWEYQVPALIGAGYRVITYDRRGFGSSSQPWNGYDYDTFADDFARLFFSAGGKLQVSEAQRVYARDIAAFASPKGTLDCIAAFSRTDFRGDLKKITIPVLIIHGDSDAIVPFEASGKRSHEAIKGSQLALIKGGPHGLNASQSEAFNKALLEFVGR